MPNKKIIFLGIIIIFLTIAGFLAWLNRPQTPKIIYKTWEIVVAYNSQAQKLILKGFQPLTEELRPDYRGAENSPYIILVKDKKGQILYQTKIHIAERIFYSIVPNYLLATQEASLKDQEIKTSIYIPYFENGVKIEIQKDKTLSLEINPNESY